MDDRTTSSRWPLRAGAAALPLLATLVALPLGGYALLLVFVVGVAAALALLLLDEGYAAPAKAERR